MKPSRTIIYLAGPVSNCNVDQKRHWRQELKFKLERDKYEFIDPTEHEDRWDPRTEMLEIDRCDLVIANLWRESIGTHKTKIAGRVKLLQRVIAAGIKAEGIKAR